MKYIKEDIKFKIKDGKKTYNYVFKNIKRYKLLGEEEYVYLGNLVMTSNSDYNWNGLSVRALNIDEVRTKIKKEIKFLLRNR